MFNIIFNKKRVSACLSSKKQHLFSSLSLSFKKQLLQAIFSKTKNNIFFLEKVRETEEDRR